MTFREVEGDLFASDAQALGHGVNCRGLMGAGIALPFREKFPLMYEEYRLNCERGLLNLGDAFIHYAGGGRWVYNIASQFEPGPNAVLWALESGLSRAMHHAETFDVKKISIPQIGCGIGGLDYADVRVVLLRTAEIYDRADLELVLYKP